MWWHCVSLQETSSTHNPGKSSVNTTVLLPTERNQVLRVQNMMQMNREKVDLILLDQNKMGQLLCYCLLAY